MKRLQSFVVIGVGLFVGLSLANGVEKSSVYERLLAKYDSNQDGRLGESEREAIRMDRLKPTSRERSRSGRQKFRYPDPVVARFDQDGNNDLNEQEFDKARKWVDRRFREITAQYDINKDGRLNTGERATLAKQVEAGKFQDMDWLMKYLTRPPRGRSDRNRDMRRDEHGQGRLKVLREIDKDDNGRLSEEELAEARTELKRIETNHERQ